MGRLKGSGNRKLLLLDWWESDAEIAGRFALLSDGRHFDEVSCLDTNSGFIKMAVSFAA